jgi:hypothetical protein
MSAKANESGSAKMGYIGGESRNQRYLLPEAINDCMVKTTRAVCGQDSSGIEFNLRYVLVVSLFDVSMGEDSNIEVSFVQPSLATLGCTLARRREILHVNRQQPESIAFFVGNLPVRLEVPCLYC